MCWLTISQQSKLRPTRPNRLQWEKSLETNVWRAFSDGAGPTHHGHSARTVQQSPGAEGIRSQQPVEGMDNSEITIWDLTWVLI